MGGNSRPQAGPLRRAGSDSLSVTRPAPLDAWETRVFELFTKNRKCVCDGVGGAGLRSGSADASAIRFPDWEKYT